MSIQEFNYLDVAVGILIEEYDYINEISYKIEESFSYILYESKMDFLNIASRVKSPESLKEKILRNKYYKKFPEAENLLFNLSDLIGVRVECRFSEDEKNIYKYLKRYFNNKEDNNYYYNENDPKLFIKLEGKQPQKQRNGFSIYRIDGKYIDEKYTVKFELQIKSLVNVFWGEIEHEIIYKNSNYIIENEFLKDIMGSIKDNLNMIDKQLVTVFKHFEGKKKIDRNSQKKHLEDIVSKVIYDLFSNKMQKSIGMVTDFKNSCETIIRYTFSIDAKSTEYEYTEVLIKALNRINEIKDDDIDFNSNITFERKIKYKNEFGKIIGDYFQLVINNEFNWNLFFRILFTLEPLDNVGDFEEFLFFLEDTFTESAYILKQKEILRERFEESFENIEEILKIQIANTLTEIDSIEIVYDYNMYRINDELESTYKFITNSVLSLDEWNIQSQGILRELDENIKQSISQ